MTQKIKPHWLAIKGMAEISDSAIRFVGDASPKQVPELNADEDDLKIPLALLRSDVYFESGDIRGEIFLENPTSKVQFRLSKDDGLIIYVGLNIKDHPYGICVVQNRDLQTNSLAGQGSSAPTGEWFQFHIRVLGSKVELFVKGIRVAFVQTRTIRSQLEVSLGGTGVIELRNLTINIVRPLAFVVMQFTDEYSALYRDVIEPVCTEYGYEVIRGDNVYTNGLIIEDIAQSIRSSSLNYCGHHTKQLECLLRSWFCTRHR